MANGRKPLRQIARHILFWLIACFVLILGTARAEPYLIMASTTSTENSGLFGYILPLFQAKTGITVRVLAVGTGQALALGRNGDVDVLFVHDTESELAFVQHGHGVERRDVMYNSFVVVGPASDPANIDKSGGAIQAFRDIARERLPFISRGDESGTHKAERRLWRVAGIDVSKVAGEWYRETGTGMGATLNMAAALNAYTLTDDATWSAFGNRQQLRLLVTDDPKLYNQYGVMLVNPSRFPSVRVREGMLFIEWITSDAGQRAIAGFRIDDRQQFVPNFARP